MKVGFSEPRGKEVLIMTVDMGILGKEKLVIYEDDEPDQASHQFAKKFGLDEKFERLLAIQIVDQIALLVEENQKIPIVVHRVPKESIKPIFKRIQSVNQLKKVTSENFGEILYNKGIILKDQVEEENQKRRIEFEEELSKNLTFKPKINETPLGTRKNSETLEYTLYLKDKQRLLKIDKEKELKFVQEKQECPFKPEINPTSKRILNRSRPVSEDKFRDLHNEAKDLKERKEALSKQL